MVPVLVAVAALATTAPVPALEVVKVYGRLAGPECFGRTATGGASCQLPVARLRDELGLGGAALDEGLFADRVEALDFRWPLKPYGVAGSPSNAKTATVNKNAETAIYNIELEARGLYDPRNPAGPLPTSLRPALDASVQREPIDSAAEALVFRAFGGGAGGLESRALDALPDPLDWYSFLGLLPTGAVFWPQY